MVGIPTQPFLNSLPNREYTSKSFKTVCHSFLLKHCFYIIKEYLTRPSRLHAKAGRTTDQANVFSLNVLADGA